MDYIDKAVIATDIWEKGFLKLKIDNSPEKYSIQDLAKLIKLKDKTIEAWKSKYANLRKISKMKSLTKENSKLDRERRKLIERLSKREKQNSIQSLHIAGLKKVAGDVLVDDIIPKEIVELRGELINVSPISLVSAIYFLVNNENKVVYVGQSVNVLGRIPEHLRDKIFHSAYYIPCSRGRLNTLERYWIDKLLPAYNRDATTKRLLKCKCCEAQNNVG